MAGSSTAKRARDDATKARPPRPSKKQKKLQAYHSDSDEVDDAADFRAVNLLDSDEDNLDNVEVDDGAASPSGSLELERGPKSLTKAKRKPPIREQPKRRKPVADAPPSDQDSDSPSNSDDSDAYSDDESGDEHLTEGRKPKSKRNDPAAFATSLSKILGTKLSSSRRGDPVLARSAAAQAASRAVLDGALEAKARRALREQKHVAMEKGRVRDVLVAGSARARGLSGGAEGVAEGTGEGETAARTVAEEKRHMRTARSAVKLLFNKYFAAQVMAAEADREARAEGVVSTAARAERAAEMSRKGFLDLIASGGGKLKRGGLEEA